MGRQGPGAREERRVVSVLFCDLIGFTAASERADPEDVRARIRPYHQLLRKQIERHGGTVEKFIGDAVMAVFGAPTAHEDDPERAIHAALRILAAIDGLNHERPELDLKVRIGVNTGEVLATLDARPEEGEGIVAGDVVNTAARIQAAAPANGVAVSEATYRITKGAFVYEELSQAELKGKSAPLMLYRVVEPRARLGSDLISATSPLVGRTAELGRLTDSFDRCLRKAKVELVTLVGEPGAGKSRLCAELRSIANARPELVTWRQGRCLPYGDGVAFWALGELVKAHAGVYESDSPEAATEKLDSVLPEVEGLASLRTGLLRLLGIDSGQPASREESFAAWRRFFELIAAEGPTVLVVEDLHWADSGLRDFLRYLADSAAAVPLLVLCTARPELLEQEEGWGDIVKLAPLTGDATAQLLEALLTERLEDDVKAAILERVAGNPLYVEEFVQLMADRGPGGEMLAFPDSLQALIAARLDALDPEHKGLLQDAAVVGNVFWPGALAAMGCREAIESARALDDLTRKEIVRPASTSSIEGEEEYAFWHILVRDVAYSQIPRAERGRRHRSAAVLDRGTRRRAPRRCSRGSGSPLSRRTRARGGCPRGRGSRLAQRVCPSLPRLGRRTRPRPRNGPGSRTLRTRARALRRRRSRAAGTAHPLGGRCIRLRKAARSGFGARRGTWLVTQGRQCRSDREGVDARVEHRAPSG